MAPGEAGRGLDQESVPGPVVEELRPGGENVTVQPRATVVKDVLETALGGDPATPSPVLSEVMK